MLHNVLSRGAEVMLTLQYKEILTLQSNIRSLLELSNSWRCKQDSIFWCLRHQLATNVPHLFDFAPSTKV